jgi:hypothetical protein
MSFSPQGLATAIGSLPHQSPEAACRVILDNIPEIPVWPQLPATDFRESMEIQYLEGLPGLVVDPVGRRTYFKTGEDITSGLEKFYENYMAEKLDYFKISPGFSRGVYEMERVLTRQRPAVLRYFKNHVTGPITVGLGRTDENKRSIYYNEMMRDVVVKGTEMKARWLLRRFQGLGVPQLCFIDEPILSAFGSSTYVSVQRSDVVQYLRDVIAAIHKEGGLAGIHCCGNTEWTILVDAGTDVISFDAFDYGETIAYYPGPLKDYLERGGVLAWGIVPTSAKIAAETPETLLGRLRSAVENLASKGIAKSLIWEKCLVTPSCGTGSLAVDLSEMVFTYLSEVSRRLRA